MRQLLRRYFPFATIIDANDYRVPAVRPASIGKPTLVIAVGDDRTVSAVADSLSGGEFIVGIIPSGDNNKLAQGLGLPTDLRSACELITSLHAIRKLDLLRINGHHYLLRVSAGFDAVLPNLLQSSRQGIGYRLRASWRALRQQQSARINAIVDGTAYSFPNVQQFGLVNMSLLPTGLQAPPVSEPMQAVELFVVAKPPRREMLRLLLNFWRNVPVSRRLIKRLPVVNCIQVDSDLPFPIQGDGAPIGTTPFSAHIASAALHVIVPHQ